MKTSRYHTIRKQLEALSEDAVDVVRQLLTDPAAPRSVRLRAAELVLAACAESGGEPEPADAARAGVRGRPRLVGSGRAPKPGRAA